LNKIIFFVWIGLALSLFFASLKNQVVFNSNSKFQKNIFTLMPQGWGFFTKNPRDKQLDVYKIDNGKINRVTIKNFSLETCFGLSRKARFVGYESAQVINSINNKYWNPDIFGNLSKLKYKTVYKYKNSNLKYLKKGSYVFVTYKIVPYKWAKSNQEKNKPIEYTLVEIE